MPRFVWSSLYRHNWSTNSMHYELWREPRFPSVLVKETNRRKPERTLLEVSCDPVALDTWELSPALKNIFFFPQHHGPRKLVPIRAISCFPSTADFPPKSHLWEWAFYAPGLPPIRKQHPGVTSPRRSTSEIEFWNPQHLSNSGFCGVCQSKTNSTYWSKHTLEWKPPKSCFMKHARKTHRNNSTKRASFSQLQPNTQAHSIFRQENASGCTNSLAPV